MRGTGGGRYRVALKRNEGGGILWAGVSQALFFGHPATKEDDLVLHTGFLHRILFEKILQLLEIIKTCMRLLVQHGILNTGICTHSSEILVK